MQYATGTQGADKSKQDIQDDDLEMIGRIKILLHVAIFPEVTGTAYNCFRRRQEVTET